MTYTDLLGVRYTPHGRSVQQGFDCYGLAIEVLRRDGISFPDLYNVGGTLDFARIDKPKNGCIVNLHFGGKYSHIGVYIGDGLMIHTVKSAGVVIEPLSHYEKKIEGFYDVSNN